MTPSRVVQLLGGCVILGVGVALLLAPRLGSDGFSMLVNGTAETAGTSFLLANVLISACFLAVARLRGITPGIGTIVQIVIVGATVTALLQVLEEPESTAGRAGMLVVAFPVLAVGIALYLGVNLGAGPMEAVALAWDPPFPFAWTYSVAQLATALVGWQLGSAVGLGTIAVIFGLGPLVALTGKLLRINLHQT